MREPRPHDRPAARLASHGRLAAVAAASALLWGAAAALAAPEAELWKRWTAHDETSTTRVDHAAWTPLLERYVSADDRGIHRFDYAAVSPTDRAILDAYLERLEATRVSELTRAEQRAFWINLYNALTIRVVLDHYPVESILDIDISPGLFSRGPWGRKLLAVEGEPVSLDDVEHRILRPIWRDPRIHYGVNCASLGCPNLQPTAFTAENTEALLEDGARDYVNHPRGARVVDGELTVSSIYHWFESDFGGSEAGVLAHLRRYARPELRRALDSVDGIDDHAYDWSLNEAGPRSR